MDSSEQKSVNLASIGVLVAPLLAAMGGLALTGTIGRVQRDEPLLMSVAIGLVILSGALWVAASTFTAPNDNTKKRSKSDIALRVISITLAVIGSALALGVAVFTANNNPRPQISSALSEDGTRLTTKIKASNLATDRRLAFQIVPLQGEETVGSIYRAYVGPDSDGNVEQTVSTPLPAGNNHNAIGIKAYTGTVAPPCDDFSVVRRDETFGSGAGCVILTIPATEPMNGHND